MDRSLPFVILEAPEGGSLSLYTRPKRVISAGTPQEIAGALAAMEEARAQGLHLAGYFSYEMGYALEPKLARLMPASRGVPLLWFGAFETRDTLSPGELEGLALGRAYAGPLAFETPPSEYAALYKRVQEYIHAGDIYQANLTLRAHFHVLGDPLALYIEMRKRAGARHGAFIADGARHVLSFSPELFFHIANGVLTAKPMKGTARRGETEAEDARLRDGLAASKKDRAENLMIVDLIRNDLGRVAQTGSVEVTDLYRIETYPTVHQMVSTVNAKLRPGTSLAALTHALFPCGSVTGAPKIRAMEVIRELEQSPRGVYCGAVGTFAPDGDASFNVAIRTLTIAEGRGEMGVGGGIVSDSRLELEYEECLVKARFFSERRRKVSLIETLRYDGKDFVRLERHLARMRHSARALHLPFDEQEARAALLRAVGGVTTALRMRLVLDEAGDFETSADPIGHPAPQEPWTYALSKQPLDSADILLQHKTDWREIYASPPPGTDEMLFVNERGELTEGTRTNIFIKRGGKLYTPPLSSGLLPGVLRGELIERGECVECVLFPADLEGAEIYLGNSLRGLIEAVPAMAQNLA